MSDVSYTKLYGAKLLKTKIALAGGGLAVFRAVESWSVIDEATTGLKVYNDILWMRLLEASEGMKLPNGCRWFSYNSVLGEVFPHGKRYYRIRKAGAKNWEYHSF